ncbi:DUF1345 domain-containing protein [Tsukamurella pseudospumae]|uniref:DUF1345 domain-containing protein n=1 Tax=Tsukamurella pseudospumae TaxID=239498 RepID=A0A138AP46_9ACTN|nr:DUF1345 domain-containing protein [Tsukamurella pseudospumae]KXP12221.1 hypothetical protein AXK60_23720 [Tsukamurella pseudospumae]
MRRSVLVPLLEVVLTLLGLVWLVVVLFFGRSAVWLLLVWDAAAVVYIVAGSLLLRRRIPDDETVPSELLAPRWQTTLFALVVSGSGLVGGLLMIATRGEDPDSLLQPVAAATVLLSWMLLHTAFAQIYARDYFAGDPGLVFPDCEHPQITEFVYFSITIGTSFAVSDVTVTKRSTRRLVIAHSVLSFFFNAAVVAIALDWIKGG